MIAASNFTVGLVQRGYKHDDVRKILGENMLRVARAVLPPQRPIDGDAGPPAHSSTVAVTVN